MKTQLIVCLSLAMVVLFAGCETDSTMKTLNEANRIVFIGDSITAYENWNTLFGVTYIRNSGIPENTTDDVLSRLSSITSSKPEKIFLLIGINDLFEGKDTSYISANYETILSKIRLESPGTIVYLQSVLPTNSEISLLKPFDSNKILILNDKLKSLSDGIKVIFIDLYPNFCGSDGKLYAKYTSDGVHPNPDGYEIFKSLESQYIN